MRLERVPEDKPVTIYGSAWNRVVDFINMVEGANTNSLPQSQRLQGAFVQNEKGANIPPFHIVKIGDPVAKPGQFDTDSAYEYQNVFRGEPTNADTNCFGITSKGIPTDIGAGNKGVGPLKVFGVCSAVVNVSDMAHGFAQPSSTDGILESTATPTILKLLYSPATGENVCKVLWLGGGESTVHAHVRVPDPPSGEEPGIAGGATVMCEVLSYSDGRDIVAGENDMLPVTNWKTERRGETNNHELKVEPWGDGWEIYDEDFICPDDSGGP